MTFPQFAFAVYVVGGVLACLLVYLDAKKPTYQHEDDPHLSDWNTGQDRAPIYQHVARNRRMAK